MSRKQRLELTWIGKEKQQRLEPRILLKDDAISYHARSKITGEDIFDNRLIYGDNLLALKSLDQEFSGKVKCVYIDPPFNTKQAFAMYEDGLEHSLWLSLMRDRLELIYNLISDDGSLFIHIDDNEIAYLICLLDEIFGRSNRISIITFKQGSATGHKSINPGVVSTSNFIVLYAKNKSSWKPNRVYTQRDDRDKRYGQFIPNIDAPFEQWKFTTLLKAFALSLGLPEKGLKKQLGHEMEELLNKFVYDNAKAVIRLARPDYNAVSAAARKMIDQSKANPQAILKLERDDHSNMYFVNGERILFYIDKMKFIDGTYVIGEPLTSIWDDVLSNNLHNEGGVEFPKGKKPESLIKRCLDLVTSKGDLVLDSFAGSGTTGAVAHKMGRRWIMIELGSHCQTHIIPRMKSVIDGSDRSGVTEATKWQGGGGFRYYTLAPSMLVKDRFGNWVISQKYNPIMLAEAVCKLMGFVYQPSQNVSEYWRHGCSTETDFIYVTTQSLTHDALKIISEEVGPKRTLLICCKAFNSHETAFPNLTLRKIPNSVLSKCEWGCDDYSLAISTLPASTEELLDVDAALDEVPPERLNRAAKQTAELSLFDIAGEEQLS